MGMEEHSRLAALEAGEIGTWEWDLADGRMRWSTQMFRNMGVEYRADRRRLVDILEPHSLDQHCRHGENVARLGWDVCQRTLVDAVRQTLSGHAAYPTASRATPVQPLMRRLHSPRMGIQ